MFERFRLQGGRLPRLTSIALAFLLLTAAYLFAWPSASILYFGADAAHLLAGIIFLVSLPFVLGKLLRNTSIPSRIGWILLTVGGALGVVLVHTGTRRSEWPLLYTHIGLCVAGAAMLASGWAQRKGWLGRGVTGAIFRSATMLVGAAAITAGAWWVRTVPWERSYRIQNPEIAPASMDAEGDGASGPFFPSSGQTQSGGQIPADYFTESDSCRRCHADIYQQWESSMHHFSSFNNAWYRKSIEYMQDTVGIRPSKWCAGCHDPALLYSGMFDRPIREVEDTPAGQAGLGCMMCHSISRVKSTTGQGDYLLEYPSLHRLAASKNPYTRQLHDFLTNLNPEPHRRIFLKPFMRSEPAQFCSACHKVHLDVPVNHYRWFRGFNEYDNWQASGVSGEGARSFYYPAKAQTCADCHMPLTPSNNAGNISGFVHLHRFAAANTALPYVNSDAAQLDAVEKFLKAGELSVDIFGISPENSSTRETAVSAATPASPEFQTMFAVGEEVENSAPRPAGAQAAPPAVALTAPLNRANVQVRRGGFYRVDVVVRTRKVGHFFPAGTVDAFDCWLELKATDDNGRVIFWSGDVEANGKGRVDPGAHFYRSLQIDAHGNPINKRNAWATRALVYVHLIPPGAADTAHYRLLIPRDAGSRVHLEAKLNYRKFAWWNTQFVFAGQHDPQQHNPAVSPDFDETHWVFTADPSKVPGGGKGIPNLPVVVVAQDAADLSVLPQGAREPSANVVLNPPDWTRWNDYGIGLFLQGDLTGAAAAFEKVTQIDPKNPDGWVNIGRVRIEEGNLEEARKALDRALALSPKLARAHFFYATMLRREGEYDQAISHLQIVLAQYPRDRVAQDDLGRILFLDRRYEDAIRPFQTALSIDPEDLEANYNLMLCYTGLGQPARAAEFQARYMRFKADEASQTLTGPYRQAHPLDNLERQPIHEHVSNLLIKPAPPAYASAGPAEKGQN
jgi:tetratricopeptide (TPR) repeat protein